MADSISANGRQRREVGIVSDKEKAGKVVTYFHGAFSTRSTGILGISVENGIDLTFRTGPGGVNCGMSPGLDRLGRAALSLGAAGGGGGGKRGFELK